MHKAMAAADEHDTLGDDDLRAIQIELETLARMTKDYPLECSLGAYDLLFESRDDIEILIESLSEEILESRDAA